MTAFKRIFRIFYYRTTNWENLFKFRTIGVIRSMYIWLMLVPMAANATENIHGSHALNVFGTDFEINFDLPFSWYYFYFSALSFVIGNLLVVFFCPQIVKDELSEKMFDYEMKYGHKRAEYELELGLDIESSRDNQNAVKEMYVIGLRNRSIIRLTTFAAYSVGLLLIAFVLFQNLVTVVAMI